MSTSYRKLRDRVQALERANEMLRARDLVLSDAWLRTTGHDYRSCTCERCAAARTAQGIHRESGHQSIPGAA